MKYERDITVEGDCMTKLVKINAGYVPSTNLVYDRFNPLLIEGFVPTAQTLDVLEWLVDSMSGNGTQIHSHVLIGAYGKGKSYAVAVFLQIIQGKLSEKAKEKLYKKIASARPSLAEALKLFDSYHLLPVIVKGGYEKLTYSLSVALKEAIEENQLQVSLPKSNFQRAIDCLMRWEHEYPQTYQQFFSMADISQQKQHLYFEDLQRGEEPALQTFLKLYPKLTAGSQFELVSDLTVVEDYVDIAAALSATDSGYHGLFIVYDEFSKYLEANHGNLDEASFRVLQDLAERGNASSGEGQLHMLLITHRDPSSYFENEHSSKEWAAISGRYTNKEMAATGASDYQIIENVLTCNKSYLNSWRRAHSDAVAYVKQRCVELGMFSDEQFGKIFSSTFPLDPIAVYVLPRISELIAQNERSLFGFLLSKDAFSLSFWLDQLKEGKSEIVDASCIYDYFEPLFRRVSSSSRFYQITVMVTTITQKFQKTNELAVNLIKVIGLLLAINDQRLLPNLNSLYLCFSLGGTSNVDLKQSLALLLEEGVIRISLHSDTFLPFAISSELQHYVAESIRKNNVFSLEEALNGFGFAQAVYATRHNDEFGVTRFYGVRVVEELPSLADPYPNGNGALYVVLGSSLDAVQKYAQKQQRIHLLFAVPSCKIIDGEKLKKALGNLAGIHALLAKGNREHLSDADLTVLQFLEEDAKAAIAAMMQNLKTNLQSFPFFDKNGQVRSIVSSEALSEFCSKAFDETYEHAPKITREDVNRDLPTTVTMKARAKVIEAILSWNLGTLANERISSQPRGMFENICKDRLVRVAPDGKTLQRLPENSLDPSYVSAIDEISRYLETGKETPQTLDVLVHRLTEGVGVKKGVIPFFLAFVCAQIGTSLIFYFRGKEEPITSDLFDGIIRSPEEYTVIRVEALQGQAIYLDALRDFFEVSDIGVQSLTNLATAMKEWFEKLSPQTKLINGFIGEDGQIHEFDGSTKLALKAIREYESDSHQLVLKKLPEAMGEEPTEACAKALVSRFREVNDALSLSESGVKSFILNQLSIEENTGSWLLRMHRWADHFGSSEIASMPQMNKLFFKKLSEDTISEKGLANSLLYLLSGVRFSEWQRETLLVFKEQLRNIVGNLHPATSMRMTSQEHLVTIQIPGTQEITIPSGEHKEEFDEVYNEIESVLQDYERQMSHADRNRLLLELLLRG